MERDDPAALVYTVAEARKLLKISRGLMYEGIRTGQIPSIRIGRRILIPCIALDKLLNDAGGRRANNDEDLPGT
ncbi:MAG: helix-turn-helix domain-containing protein [Chloroflexi bacterium]|nr:helix-turn-helix domain-containing protein [Chloroflexota bacterium]